MNPNDVTHLLTHPCTAETQAVLELIGIAGEEISLDHIVYEARDHCALVLGGGINHPQRIVFSHLFASTVIAESRALMPSDATAPMSDALAILLHGTVTLLPDNESSARLKAAPRDEQTLRNWAPAGRPSNTLVTPAIAALVTLCQESEDVDVVKFWLSIASLLHKQDCRTLAAKLIREFIASPVWGREFASPEAPENLAALLESLA